MISTRLHWMLALGMLCFWEAAPVWAESITVGAPPPREKKADPSKPEPPKPLLQPRTVQPVAGPDANEPGRMVFTLSLQFHTPLVAETDFEGRFSSWGGGALFSIPLFDIALRAFVHLEIGALGTFSRVEIPGETYNHATFDFPLRFRILYPLTDDSRESWIGELFLGPVFRLLEYDNSSARSADGPLFGIDSGWLQPDFALGISRGLGSHLRARFLVGYQYLALAAEFSF